MTPKERILVSVALGSLAQVFPRWKRIKPSELEALRVLLRRIYREHRSDCLCCSFDDPCEYGLELAKFIR